MSSPLERAVEVMDRLRSPGGCPWDAAQTHESLTRYLLEETYEVLDAIESGDRALLREELGDLLLQVLFHARLAQESPEAEAFGIDDVADDLVAKLVRRHPHVFADEQAGDARQLNEAWELQKIAEKGRTSAVDGVPVAQPALALAAKLVSRAGRAGKSTEPEADGYPGTDTDTDTDADTDADTEADTEADTDTEADADVEIGRRLFEVVRQADALGVDPEGALRRVTVSFRSAIIAAEGTASS